MTPERVWSHYGLTAGEAQSAGMNPQMFNSFLDGTKSAIEMAAIANSCGLDVPSGGLLFPPCGVDDLPHVMRPVDKGGVLEKSGVVEVVSSLERDGRPGVPRFTLGRLCRAGSAKRLRGGLLQAVWIEDRCQRAVRRDVQTLSSDRAGVEHLNPLGGVARGADRTAARLRGDAVAVAKRALRAGELLDGEGGYTVWAN